MFFCFSKKHDNIKSRKLTIKTYNDNLQYSNMTIVNLICITKEKHFNTTLGNRIISNFVVNNNLLVKKNTSPLQGITLSI